MAGKTKALRMTQFVVLLMFVTAVFAADPVETIDARARGTSTQMGRDFDIKIIINQYSTSEDRQTLVDAFKKGGSDGLARALFKMKPVGRISIPSTVGYTIAFARAIPTPTGRKVRFVTNRKLAFGEQARSTRSESYDLTAGEIDINDQDKSKSTGVLYPAAQLGVNQDGELQFNLYQNPWQLVNILDWTSKGKD